MAVELLVRQPADYSWKKKVLVKSEWKREFSTCRFESLRMFKRIRLMWNETHSELFKALKVAQRTICWQHIPAQRGHCRGYQGGSNEGDAVSVPWICNGIHRPLACLCRKWLGSTNNFQYFKILTNVFLCLAIITCRRMETPSLCCCQESDYCCVLTLHSSLEDISLFHKT